MDRILIRATNWLGDAVMSLPALRALKQRYPAAHIAVLARPWVADLYRREPFAGEILTEGATWRAHVRTIGELRARRFDTAVLLPNSFATALTVWAARVPRRIGYNRDGRGALLTDAVSLPPKSSPPKHETLYYLELLLRAGVIDAMPEPRPVVLHAASDARRAGERLLERMGVDTPALGVSPGAQNSRAKQWPPERFVEAAAAVASLRGWTVVLFGSAEERPLCIGMASELRRRAVRVLSVAGETTLAQFIELAAACRVFLTNDSGAMHVASALAVPTVAIFGPTEWTATAPSGPVARIVRQPVDCAPCMLRDCPTDHRCMLKIPAEAVAQAALELVK